MFNNRMNLQNFAFALFGICLLVQSVQAVLDVKNLTCSELPEKDLSTQKQKFNWLINNQATDQTEILNCYKFSFLPEQSVKKFQFEILSKKVYKNQEFRYFTMLFLTKSEIQIPNNIFDVNEFLENKFNGQAIATSLNGLYSYQYTSKLYYEEKEQLSDKQGEGVKQTYYVYIYYFKYKFRQLDSFPSATSLLGQKNYYFNLILNPDVKDLCNGYSNGSNICKCYNPKKITEYCNVDVVKLSRFNSNMKINPQKFRESQVFLYLNHTELYQGISEEKKFKLNINNLQRNSSNGMVVYEKLIEEQDINDILPMTTFYLNKFKENKLVLQENYEFIIQKEIKDRIFYVYLNNDFEIQVSLTIIKEENNQQSENSDKNELNEKTKNNKEVENINQTPNKNIQETCYELENVNKSANIRKEFSWVVELKKSYWLRCFTFELPANQGLNEFLISVNKYKKLNNYSMFFLFFITKEKLKLNDFSLSDFVKDKYKDLGFTSALDQLYKRKFFPKIYYKDKDVENNIQSAKTAQRYYFYIYSFRQDIISKSGLKKFYFDSKYSMKLILNPKGNQLCNGFATQDSACQCYYQDYITLDCDIKVVNIHDIKGSALINLDHYKYQFSNLYLYLNHDELYSGISKDKSFKLVLKAIGKNEINKFAVFDEFVDKHEINGILPDKKYAAMEIYSEKYDSSLYKEEHEFIITKETKDRIFLIKSYGLSFNLKILATIKEEDK